MISLEALAIGNGAAIGAARAIAGVTSRAAQAAVNMIFRIEVSPFQSWDTRRYAGRCSSGVVSILLLVAAEAY
jgi:hypothetical protein